MGSYGESNCYWRSREGDLGEMNNLKICVITPTLPEMQGGYILVSRFIKILEPLADAIFVITGNFPEDAISNKKINIKNIKNERKKEPTVIKVLRYILTQLRISVNLIKKSKNIDIVIFFIGVDLLLPIISAKLLKKRTILIATGSLQKSAEKIYSKMLFGSGGIIFSRIGAILEKINYILSDVIVVYTENLIQQLGLEKRKNKICVAHEHFLDFNEFKIKKGLDERDNLVGYIGRLSEEKGVLNFVKAIPEIMKKRGDLEFLIGGDGQLRDKIERYLEGENLNDKVKLPGWIPREEFLTYLNELKLFVLPSYTEGLPYTILEAMACGTPVLATPVGAIPDVIKDGETGFIMENNSPECIAENIVRALAHPNINEITKNARALVEEKYNYQAAVDGYRIILSSTF